VIVTVICRKSDVLCVYCHRPLELLINGKPQECVQSFNRFFFYCGVKALAILSKFLKMCYFGRHITPLPDAQECVQSINHFFFYRCVQALATLSEFIKMCYFGRHITPLLDVTKICGSPAVFH